MIILFCLSCEFHEVKPEPEDISYCHKENCWSRFSKCVAKEALRRFLEKETRGQPFTPPDSSERTETLPFK